MTTVRTAAIPIQKFMRHPQLLGPSFAGDSWRTWEVVIKAAHGLPLADDELAIFKSVAGDREPPARRVKELVCVIGRRGGKDAIAALLSTHASASFNPQGQLRPGERAHVVCIACSREQAALVFNYIKGNFESVPALRKLMMDSNADTINLRNRVSIQVTTNSFRTVRGRSVLCCIFDETAMYRSEDTQNSDVELAAAVRPSLNQFVGSMLIMISTAYRRSGLLYDRFKKFYGKDDPDTLVVAGSTRDFNPTFPQEEVDKAIAEDAAKFSSEYLKAVWRDDLTSFIDRALIEAATDPDIIVRPPLPHFKYVAGIDASGGRGDSYTACVAHAEKQTAVLDCLIEIKPPFDPNIATSDICATLKSYGIRKVTGDHYAANWTVSAFQRNGITFTHSERNRSEIYLDVLPLFTSGRARLLDNKRLAQQFCNLERRTFPSGQEKINHAVGTHDDCCNSAALAMVLATSKKTIVITTAMLQQAARPTPYGRPRLTPIHPMKGFFQ